MPKHDAGSTVQESSGIDQNGPQGTEEVKVWMEADGAWDRRDPDPSKNYGIHGVELTFYMLGISGAVQFKLYTGWLLPETVGVTEPFDWKSGGGQLYPDALKAHYCGKQYSSFPMAVDLGYHARAPQYEEQSRITDDCPVIDGPCFYDGSSLNAEPVMETFLREGSPGVWRELGAYYERTFDVKVSNLDD